jgi:hypothetical protein
MSTDQSDRLAKSVLPLRANAADEVARLRTIQSDLLEQRTAIDRELEAVGQLLKTYVSYDPSLRTTDDQGHGVSVRHSAKYSRITRTNGFRSATLNVHSPQSFPESNRVMSVSGMPYIT